SFIYIFTSPSFLALSPFTILSFFLSYSFDHLLLLSFPTRRSSDLSFYFFALFDYEIACLLVQLISLFAFYKLHNSYVNRSFLGGTNVRHFRSFRQPLPSKV